MPPACGAVRAWWPRRALCILDSSHGQEARGPLIPVIARYMEVSMRKIALFLGALGLCSALAAGAAERVDINAANAAELATGLVGIGQSKAEAIVEYRAENGPFKSADDLGLVKGIGPATIAKNRDRIGVGAAGDGQASAKE